MNHEQIDKIVELAAKLAGRADQLDQVLILYRFKDDGGADQMGSMDNSLTLAQSLWMIEGFKFWLQAGAAGMLPRKE